MKFIFVETSKFSKTLDSLIEGVGLEEYMNLKADYEDVLSNDPNAGDVIRGTGGLRKLRLRVKGRGKRGGFRLIYLYLAVKDRIILLGLYEKSQKTDLTVDEKKQLKRLVEILKGNKE